MALSSEIPASIGRNVQITLFGILVGLREKVQLSLQYDCNTPLGVTLQRGRGGGLQFNTDTMMLETPP